MTGAGVFNYEVPPTRAARARVGWVDQAKGIGILAIVFGHVWRGVYHAGLGISEDRFASVDDWLYAWHVPLFFVLAGLFAVRSAERGAGAFVGDKVRTILWPYVVWSVLQGCARRFLIKGAEEGGAFSIERLVTVPYAQFWFFMCLFVCLMLFLGLYEMRIGRWGILIVAAAFYVTAVWHVPLGPWGMMYLARNYLFYVALGVAGAPYLVRLMLHAPTWALLVCSAVAFGMLTVLTWEGWGNVQVTHPSGALAGTFGVIALVGAMERFGRVFSWVEYLGRVSLPIYVAHVLALAAARAGLVKGLHVSSVPVHLVVGTAVGVAVPVALAWGAERFKMGWLFALPKSGRRGA